MATTVVGNQPNRQQQQQAQRRDILEGSQSEMKADDNNKGSNNHTTDTDRHFSGTQNLQNPSKSNGTGEKSRDVSTLEENSCPSSIGDNSNGATWTTRRNSNSNSSSLSSKRLEATQKLNLILPVQRTSSLTTHHVVTTAATNSDSSTANNTGNDNAEGQQMDNNAQLQSSANRQLFIESLAQQLASSANVQGPDVSLFTGLPSCTPASADRLAATATINPFFWGLANSTSANSEPVNGGENGVSAGDQQKNQHQTSGATAAAATTTNEACNQQRENKQPRLSLQAANALSPMILSPLSMFGLSPEQEAWLCLGLSPTQHPLASVNNHPHAQYNSLLQPPHPHHHPQQHQQQPLNQLPQLQQNFIQRRHAQDLTSHHQQSRPLQLASQAPGVPQTPMGTQTVHNEANLPTCQYQRRYFLEKQQTPPLLNYVSNQYQISSAFTTATSPTSVTTSTPVTTAAVPQPRIQLNLTACANDSQPVHQDGHSPTCPSRRQPIYSHQQQASGVIMKDTAPRQQYIFNTGQQQQPPMMLSSCIRPNASYQPVAARQNHAYTLNLNHQGPYQHPAIILVNQNPTAQITQNDLEHYHQQVPSPTSSSAQTTLSQSGGDQSGNQQTKNIQQRSHPPPPPLPLSQQPPLPPPPSTSVSVDRSISRQDTIGNLIKTRDLTSAHGAINMDSPIPSCSTNIQSTNVLQTSVVAQNSQPSTNSTSRQTSANGSPVHRSNSDSRLSPANTNRPPSVYSVSSGDTNKDIGSMNTNQNEKQVLYLLNGGRYLKSDQKQVESVTRQQTTINENGEVVVKKKSRGGRKKKLVTHDEMIARKNRSKERNRVAAKRCRQKRKQLLDELKDKIDSLTEMNHKLQKENSTMKNELQLLKQHYNACEL